ncbi:hypothetical protein [Streptomyces sp. NPDC101165]|uniref:hypothetical protein n=1 Tax=Streptomyces sp. NPDC101165 TaxID=3366119 RepID=UPI00381AFF57
MSIKGPPVGPTEAGPGDPRYEALRRGFSQRWVAGPDHVVVAARPADVIAALNTHLAGTVGFDSPPQRLRPEPVREVQVRLPHGNASSR